MSHDEEFEDPEWGSDKPMSQRVDLKDSVDGGEVIASDCKSEGEGFDSPSTLPKKIEYDKVKPGLWISKDKNFVIQKVRMITQKEIDDLLDEIDSKRYKPASKWTLLGFFLIGSLIMGIINVLIGVW